MTGASERNPRDSTGRQPGATELELTQILAAIFDEFPSSQVTVLPLRSHDDEEPLRVRPLTPDRVRKVLRRLRQDLPAEGFSGNVIVAADDFHLQIEQRAEPTGHRLEVDLVAIRSIDPVPHAAIANALRIRELRARLLESGAHNYESLATGRNCTVEAARQFVSRARNKHQLITVQHEERTFVPQFLLDDVLDPIPEFAPIIEGLAEVGERGWAAWTWLVTPSSWLDGDTPVELVRGGNPDAVYEAVARRISNAA